MQSLVQTPVQAPSPSVAPLADRLVRDTIAAVFRHAEYARGTRVSFWSKLMRWIRGILSRLFAGGGDHPVGSRVVTALLIGLGVLVLARVAYGAWLARGGAGRGARAAGARAARGGDPWAAARAEADAGRYLEAAHALYRALLQTLVERERVRLHPSKTAGDYVRDLRALRSPLLPRFRDFARAYERVAYGTAPCGRADYERLHALAEAVAAPARAGRAA